MNINELKNLKLNGRIYVDLNAIPDRNEPLRYNVENIRSRRLGIILEITQKLNPSQDVSSLQSIINKYKDEISIDYTLKYIDPHTKGKYFRGSDLYKYYIENKDIIFIGMYIPIT